MRCGIGSSPPRLVSSIDGYRFGGYFGLTGDLAVRARNGADGSSRALLQCVNVARARTSPAGTTENQSCPISGLMCRQFVDGVEPG